MLSPKLRRDIFELWTMFWSSGMSNPLTAIEQITYLLFLKYLEPLDKDRPYSIYGPRVNCQLPHHPDDSINIKRTLPPDADEALYCIGHGTCRWSYIAQRKTAIHPKTGEDITVHEHLSQYVFPWLRVLEKTISAQGNGNNASHALASTASRLEDAYFQLPREKTATLNRAIVAVDTLFKQVDTSDDIIGDIFEFLLSEIQSSGKNGQFRTPRHIIRFIIELVDPDRNDIIADPAAGTGGFLINSLQHIFKRYTDSDRVVLEWDGTPHRIYAPNLPFDQYPDDYYPPSTLFTGYDNDRTMVRIGWMNLILHGLRDPNMLYLDTLSKAFNERAKYTKIFANPPFAGTVDRDDLNERFRDLATNKSELLFVQLILDLLQVGGWAGVIVAEGVLFGSTNAHKELRRHLLLDNHLKGVISLPAGIFQPYSGVKTSILVFQKINEYCRAGMTPHTEHVWFYEVSADGYTLDAKRNPKPQPNDLWDALEKWRNRDAAPTDYYQPDIFPVRWRLVDDRTISIFAPTHPEIAHEKDNVLGIHELFREFADTSDPQTITQLVVEEQQPHIRSLYQHCLDDCEASLIREQRKTKDVRTALEDAIKSLNRLFDEVKHELLEYGKDLPEFAHKSLDPLQLEARREAETSIEQLLKRISDDAGLFAPASEATQEKQKSNNGDVPEIEDRRPEVASIVRAFARLDGYSVQLRTNEVENKQELKNGPKHWIVPVRVFARNDEWVSRNGQLTGSHDEQGNIHPEYVRDMSLYNANGTVKKASLDSSCIEYNDFNLSAGRYKPFVDRAVTYPPPAQLTRELQDLEQQIQEGLGTLLELIEDRR